MREHAADYEVVGRSTAAERAELITRGYQRLCELQRNRRGLTVQEYPLADVIARWQT